MARLTSVRLRTARLTLRPFTADDLAAFHTWHSDPAVTRYLSWNPLSDAATRQMLRRRLRNGHPPTVEGTALNLAVQLADHSAPIGEVSLELVSDRLRCAEIGCVIAPEHAGHGYAAEAGSATLRFGFTDMGLHRIIGTCHADHAASQHVMTRMGMRREAHFVEAKFRKGAWIDATHYAILDHEWRAQSADPAPAPAAQAPTEKPTLR